MNNFLIFIFILISDNYELLLITKHTPAKSNKLIPVNVTQVLPVIPKTSAHNVPAYKQRNFQLFQTTKHAKVSCDPHAKPKVLLVWRQNAGMPASVCVTHIAKKGVLLRNGPI